MRRPKIYPNMVKDGGIAVAIDDEVGEADKAVCREAAESCPSEAIQITD